MRRRRDDYWVLEFLLRVLKNIFILWVLKFCFVNSHDIIKSGEKTQPKVREIWKYFILEKSIIINVYQSFSRLIEALKSNFIFHIYFQKCMSHKIINLIIYLCKFYIFTIFRNICLMCLKNALMFLCVCLCA